MDNQIFFSECKSVEKGSEIHRAHGHVFFHFEQPKMFQKFVLFIIGSESMETSSEIHHPCNHVFRFIQHPEMF